MGNPGDTGADTTTIGAYRSTAAILKQEQRELSARLDLELTMPELLERIVTEWRAYKLLSGGTA